MRTLWHSFRRAFRIAVAEARQPAPRAKSTLALNEKQARLDALEARVLALEADQAMSWGARMILH